MKCKEISGFIVDWLLASIKDTGMQGIVVGISGGIDSAVTSTLCAKTGLPVLVLAMPILQAKDQHSRAEEQIEWLKKGYDNVASHVVDLTDTFLKLKDTLPLEAKKELALANTRSRLRMITLYCFANSNSYLVCGTGNKIEDYGIGFFTKYGDGGVDLSPIGDLAKSEVFELASYLGVPASIQNAAPTDGLWENDKTDEDQIGATYDEIEWAMDYCFTNNILSVNEIKIENFTQRQVEVLKIFMARHDSNRHKMLIPPVCDLSSVKI